MQNTSVDDSVNVTFVSSPTKKKRDLIAADTAKVKASAIPYASAGAAIPNDGITKDETLETDERSSNTSQANKTNSKTRSSKSFFKRKAKSVKQRNSSNNNSNEAHGFISSFNQITSNNLPVITSATTTMLRNVVSGSGTSGGNKRSGADNFATGIIDDCTSDYSMEQILNKKIAKDELNKYSKRKETCYKCTLYSILIWMCQLQVEVRLVLIRAAFKIRNASEFFLD